MVPASRSPEGEGKASEVDFGHGCSGESCRAVQEGYRK